MGSAGLPMTTVQSFAAFSLPHILSYSDTVPCSKSIIISFVCRRTMESAIVHPDSTANSPEAPARNDEKITKFARARIVWDSRASEASEVYAQRCFYHFSRWLEKGCYDMLLRASDKVFLIADLREQPNSQGKSDKAQPKI
jgi:hypothetical protein